MSQLHHYSWVKVDLGLVEKSQNWVKIFEVMYQTIISLSHQTTFVQSKTKVRPLSRSKLNGPRFFFTQNGRYRNNPNIFITNISGTIVKTKSSRARTRTSTRTDSTTNTTCPNLWRTRRNRFPNITIKFAFKIPNLGTSYGSGHKFVREYSKRRTIKYFLSNLSKTYMFNV